MRISERQLYEFIEDKVREAINERVVMKTGNSNPMPPMGNAPMQQPMDMGNEMPPMGDDMNNPMPPMDGQMDNNGNQSEFDTNFDAGVEADEDTDPKKYIQQLTGKLSQSLLKYSTDNGQPDPELCKYVANMIAKQAAKGLSDEDKKEVIKKINMTNDEVSSDKEGMNDEEPMDGGDEQEPMMERKISKKEALKIFEGVNILMNNREKEKKETPNKIDKNIKNNKKNSPFLVK